MPRNHDPVDNVLESLGSRVWPGDRNNQQLKEKIMQQYKTQRSGSYFRSRGALIATLAIVILGSVGFTAAGGFELIKGWIVTIEVDGAEGVTIDADDVQIETDANGMTTITIDSADVEGLEEVEEGATVTITAIAADGRPLPIHNADGKSTGKDVPDND